VDLTSLIARENGLSIDEEGFQKELQIQKERSRAATAVETDDWLQVNPDVTTEFIGYDSDTADVHIIKYRKVSQKQKTFYQLVLNQTPFYPEGGGQVGDKGMLKNDTETISIFDTKKENNLIIHLTDKVPADLSGVFSAQVDVKRRDKTSLNHSATHLLHHALRTVLGTHVEQKGSLVNSEYLRFDFSHFAKVTDEEMEQIESIVTNSIHENITLDERRAVPIDEVKAMGAMALFGEKYGENVRVIKFGDSVELCGGIHVSNTAKIGLFKITSESAIAAGMRRIIAITGEAAEAYFREKAEKLDSISLLLKNPKDLHKAVEDLIQKNLQLTKEIEQLQREKAKIVKSELKAKITTINGINFLGELADVDTNSVKDILFQLKGETTDFVGILGNADGDKCALSLIISDNLVEDKKWNASQIIREVATHIQGGGGGQAFFATAGGKKSEGLKTAIEAVKSRLN
jgi:alanyl-tRNA synthetase